MADTPQQKLSKAQKALDWVKARLGKRRRRVNFCHDKKVYWNRKAAQAHREGRDANFHRAVAKAAYWNELEDKAILGRKQFNKRRKHLAKKVEALKKKLPHQNDTPSGQGVSIPDRPWNPSRRQIANWIIPWLDKVWARGVRFSVTSGYRSDEYQCQVCASMCSGGCQYGCPGRCARPGTSNHRGYVYPLGAVDVTNYYAVGAALRAVGSPLHNSLGAQDPVHMSYSGR